MTNKNLFNATIHSESVHLPPPVSPIHGERLKAMPDFWEKRSYEQHEIIFEAGELGDEILFLECGRVRIFIPLTSLDKEGSVEEFHLEDVEPNRFFGEVAVLYGDKRSATARAVVTTDVWFMSAGRLNDFLRHHPEIGRSIMESMAHRLVRSASQIRYAPLENANDIFDADETVTDRKYQWATEMLGSHWFLYAFVTSSLCWVVVSHVTQVVSSLACFGLALSILQIIIGAIVLNNQIRTERREKALSDTAYNASIRAEAEIRSLHRKIDKLPNPSRPSASHRGGEE